MKVIQESYIYKNVAADEKAWVSLLPIGRWKNTVRENDTKNFEKRKLRTLQMMVRMPGGDALPISLLAPKKQAFFL